MFRGIYNHEVQDALIGLKLNKSFIGTPPKCIKLACNFISEPLTRLFNLSLSQGIMPNLTNRKQYVALGETESSYQTVVCGVPQGSSLGPFLFSIYINDLPNSSEFLSFKIFADDTNLFVSAKDIKSLELQMNLALKKVKEWCDINKLSLNLKKTN